MKPQEYITKLRMDHPDLCDKFSRPEFLRLLDTEFMDCIKEIEEDHEISYIEFRDLVRKFEAKFKEISTLKKGKPFTRDLWNAFYARFILPHRAAYFPITHRRILYLVEKRNREKNKDVTN